MSDVTITLGTQGKEIVLGTFRDIAAASQKMGKGAFGDLLAPIAKVTAAVGSVGAIMKGISGSLDLGAEMQDDSNRTGIAVERLVGLRKAFKDAGVDAEALPGAINKMQRSLAGMGKGGGAATNVLKGLGLDPQQLASAKPDEAFRKIGEAINALPNATERSAAAMAIFGKSGGELLQVFSSPAFKEAGNISNTARFLGENAASFKEAHEALSHVGSKLSGFFVGISSGFVPALGEVIDDFEKMDFSKQGQALGNIVGNFYTDFEDASGKAADFLATTLVTTLPQALLGIGEVLVAAAAKFEFSMVKAMRNPLNVIEAGLQYAIEKMMEWLGKVPYLNEKLGVKGFTASSFDSIKKEVSDRGNGVENSFASSSPDMAALAADGKARIKAAWEKAKQDIAPLATATAATQAANEEGRKKANDRYQRDLTGGAYDPNDLGMGQKFSIVADSLAKVGGGGNALGPGSNPILEENKRQTSLLQQINQNLQFGRNLGGGATFDFSHP